MLALASTALAAPIKWNGSDGTDRGLGARPPIGSPLDHHRSARSATEVCVGDRETFNPFPQWGTVCSSYAELERNRNWCERDRDANGRSAAEVCFECGACLASATEPLTADPMSGMVEASSCNTVWGNNYFGINKELYLANQGKFKVGEAIIAGGEKYYIDAMQIHGNCNSDVALVYVANTPECVDGTPWRHTAECGFGGKIVKPLSAGVDSWVLVVMDDYIEINHPSFCPVGYHQASSTECQSIADAEGEVFDDSHNSPIEAGCYRWSGHMTGTDNAEHAGAFEHMEFRAAAVQPCLIPAGEGSCFCARDTDSAHDENKCMRNGVLDPECRHNAESEFPECIDGYLPMRGDLLAGEMYETLCRKETGSGGYPGQGFVAYGGEAPYFNAGPPITLEEYEMKLNY